jgi:multidrug efflux system outer membrane protein
MAQEENRQNLILSLVTNVAQSYICLLALDHQLQIVREVHANRIQNEKLIRDRFRFGLSSDLELKQAESETALAAEQIPLFEKNIRKRPFRFAGTQSSSDSTRPII